MTGELLKFPESAIVRKQLTSTDVEESVTTMKLVHVDQTLEALMEMIMDRLFSAGFDFSEMNTEEDRKMAQLILEAIRAMMLGYYGVSHPFQKMAAAIIVHDDDGDFDLIEKISLTFPKMSIA